MKSGLFVRRDAVKKLSAMMIATVFACLIALQAYVFWKSLRQVEAPPAAEAMPASNTSQDTLDVGRLAATHLFGDIEKTLPQDIEVKEDKSLNLTLRGIVANSGGNTSLAIIESKPDGEETFALGDTVFNKGKLNSIAVDYVILLRNDGRLARLQLPEQESIESGNEDYLPQSQPAYVEPAYVEPETPTPEQSLDNNPVPEPAVAIQPEPEPENQNQADTQPETASEAPPDETTGDNQDTTPAQP
jgi:type II secretory pathway component PulC